MTDVIKNLLRGTDATGSSYHDIMQQVTVHSLRTKAGYVAPVGVFADEPKAAPILYEYTGHNVSDFHSLVQVVKDYGWIAGGSALHFVHNEKIGYGDVDIFCVSQNAYQHLKNRLHGNITSSHNRSCTIENCFWDEIINQEYTYSRAINLVSPVDGQDWTHPASVLQEFDLSVAAVAIIEPGLAYTLHKDDVMEKRMNYIGNCRNPVKFWRRVMKYYNRGCLFGFDFFTDLMNDEKTRELVYMAQDLYDMQSHKNNITASFVAACWAINDYEGYEATSDSVDNDYNDYSDGWY